MAIRNSGDSPVLLFGRLSGVSESIAAALRGRDVPVRRDRHPVGGMPTDAGLGAAVCVLDADIVAALLGHSWAARRRLRVCGNAVCESALSAVFAGGARRVLLVCDVRGLSFGQRIRALRWVRDLADRIEYESSINGSDELVTSYALLDVDDDVHRIAGVIAGWQTGDPVVVPAGRGQRLTTACCPDGEA